MMNWIWVGLILFSILCAAFTGQMQALFLASFESAERAVWVAFKLIGIMALWLGIMRVAQDGGLLHTVARALRRPMRWLFPGVPAEHPATSAMVMNFGANLLGLGNAATPLGIKAMSELDKLNRHKGTATNAMCLFLAINTSGLSLLPTGTIGLRAIQGSKDPASIWLPTILATVFSTTCAIIAAKLLQRRRRYDLPTGTDQTSEGSTDAAPPGAGDAPPDAAQLEVTSGRAGFGNRVFVWLCVLAFLGGAVFHFVRATLQGLEVCAVASAVKQVVLWLPPFVERALTLDAPGFLSVLKEFFSFWAVPALMGGLLLFGLRRKVRVYETLVAGAKEGFDVAVRIIPYLVAIVVAVAMFEKSGAMQVLRETLGQVTGYLGMPTEVLPMAVIRPLSGSGASAYMISVMSQYGPDSFAGQMVSVMQGSMDTTFYILAVYFGSVQVVRVRHALAAGLLADLAGIVATVALCHIFF